MSVEKPQSHARPDPTSTMHNNAAQASSSEKSDSTAQPSPSTGRPSSASSANEPHVAPSSWKKRHLKDKEQMAEVYVALKSLQNDLSETSFRRSLQLFMAWIKTMSEPLAKYFEKKYVGRTREWAACFRVGTRANTNMFVERFHRTLKEVYLEKKQNRRVVHLIFKLRKIVRDKAFEQLIKGEKGQSTL